jgi:hypothetical protein
VQQINRRADLGEGGIGDARLFAHRLEDELRLR